MALKFVVAVIDRAIMTFAQPVTVPSTAAAVRSFIDEANNPAEGNQLNKHPEDFELHQLAIFDDETGKFENQQLLLIRGKDAVKGQA